MLMRFGESVKPAGDPLKRSSGRTIARETVAKELRAAGYRSLDKELREWEGDGGLSVTLPRGDPISFFLAGKVLSIAGVGKREVDEILYWR